MEPDHIAPAMAAANLKALGEGANARRAGRPRDANPHPWWRSEHGEWDEGWVYRDRELREGGSG
jgi:hypothetical protein